MGVQGVDGGIVILILVSLNSWSVKFVSDQLNVKLVHNLFEVDREH